jgi:hypothetical protein
MIVSGKKTLSNLDPQKRETLRKLVRGTAFAIPVVASFSMNEVSLGEPRNSAFVPNSTGCSLTNIRACFD